MSCRITGDSQTRLRVDEDRDGNVGDGRDALTVSTEAQQCIRSFGGLKPELRPKVLAISVTLIRASVVAEYSSVVHR